MSTYAVVLSFEAEQESIRGNWGITEEDMRRKYGDPMQQPCHNRTLPISWNSLAAGLDKLSTLKNRFGADALYE
jgi:hypothetical protein